jgi:hypothetical protein
MNGVAQQELRQRATPNKKTALTNAALALDHAEVVPCPMLLGTLSPSKFLHPPHRLSTHP